MTQAQAIKIIIETLEHAQARTAMFMYNADRVDVVEGFISGFNVAWRRMGYSISQVVCDGVFAQRGWYRFENRAELLSMKTGKNMRDSSMTDAEIIHELFAIEIDCWRSLRDTVHSEKQE